MATGRSPLTPITPPPFERPGVTAIRRTFCWCEKTVMNPNKPGSSKCYRCNKVGLCADLAIYQNHPCICLQPERNALQFCDNVDCLGYLTNQNGAMEKEARITTMRMIKKVAESDCNPVYRDAVIKNKWDRNLPY